MSNVTRTLIRPGTTLGDKQLLMLATQTKGIAALKDAVAKYALRGGCCVIPKVEIGPYGVGVGHEQFTGDSMACYQYVLLFLATRDGSYAEKAAAILSSWCCGCVAFNGANAPLESAWGSVAFVRSAELLKYKWPGWTPKHEGCVNAFIDTIMMPNLRGKRYLEIYKYNNNWSLTVLEALIQIAIFKNNVVDFDWALSQYRTLAPLTYVGSLGLNTDSGRDEYHGLFGMSSHIQIAEMAWHQGIKDLYTESLRKSIEYHAGMFNGHFTTPKDILGVPLVYKWAMPCAWSIGLNHYVNRAKIAMPETTQLMLKKHPEMSSFCWGPGVTHWNTF